MNFFLSIFFLQNLLINQNYFIQRISGFFSQLTKKSDKMGNNSSTATHEPLDKNFTRGTFGDVNSVGIFIFFLNLLFLLFN